MTDVTPIALEDVPKDIGRNDPCPCNSGKKYKKCCFKVHKIAKETQKTSAGVEDLVKEHTSSWDFFQMVQGANHNNLLNLVFDCTHELGPFRKDCATQEAFISKIADGGTSFAQPDMELMRTRHDGPDLILLLASGMRKSNTTKLNCQVLTLRRNELDADGKERETETPGFRVWNVVYSEVAKSAIEGRQMTFDDVGVTWSWAK